MGYWSVNIFSFHSSPVSVVKCEQKEADNYITYCSALHLITELSYFSSCFSDSTGLRAASSFCRLYWPTLAWAPILYLPSSSDVLGTKSGTSQLLVKQWANAACSHCTVKGNLNINMHQGYMTPWSQTVRNLWWWTTDWSYLCCTHLLWQNDASHCTQITV